MDDNLPGSIIIAGRRRDRRRVRLRPAQLRREGDDRRVPRPRRAAGGRRGLGRADQAVQAQAGIKVLTDDPGRQDRGHGLGRPRHRHRPDGKQQTLEADKVLQAIGFKPRIDGYGLEKTGVEADRARRDRDRRADADQRPAHLRHRRRDGQADARARRRGDGHHRRRDHRGRGDDGARLRHDAARDLLPAADRQLRLHRGAGARAGLRRQGGEVPVHGERQGARARRRRPASSS